MISVIIYGRNDSHGYNMAKRVALSLNNFALHLTAPDDEILFVDYNTPDELPTFPETLWDTLTPEARRKTRVLRLRPAVHRRFEHLTQLKVLEPIARNVGLRRSNPRNRWILSSNSDNIIVPRKGALLSEIAGGLAGDRLYGLPRFELPDIVWQSLDRRDPAAAMADLARLAAMSAMDEAVMGVDDVAFDNPGDFQLVERATLFAIDGFDERMVLGWHIDHNLARRLQLRWGRLPESLGADFALYHCAHTKQATATHNAGRIENDPARFVHDLAADDIPGQRDNWGCADADIEEVDPSTDAFIGWMATTAGAPLEPARYRSDGFGNFGYDAAHVALHAVDYLSRFPKSVRIGWIGCRQDLQGAIIGGLSALGFENRLAVPQGPAGSSIEVVDRDAILNDADIIGFEFGLLRDSGKPPRPRTGKVEDLTAEETAALEAVAAAFERLVEMERRRVAASATPRKVIVVNAVHGPYEAIIDAALASPPVPFTTRLRYGEIMPGGPMPAAGGGGGSGPGARILKAMPGRKTPIDPAELSAALGLAEEVKAAGAPAAASARLRLFSHLDLIAGIHRSGLLGELFGTSEADRTMAIIEGLANTASAQAGIEVGTRPAPAEIAGPRLAGIADWADPAWLEGVRLIARRTDGPVSLLRSGWIWERAETIHLLDRQVKDRAARDVLVIATQPDPVIAALSQVCREVTVLQRAAIDAAPEPARTASAWMQGGVGRSAVIREADAASIAGRTFDAVIVPHGAVLLRGFAGLAPFLRFADSHLREGGILVIAADTDLAGDRFSSLLSPEITRELVGRLQEHTAYSAGGAPAFAIGRSDAGLVGGPVERDAGLPLFGFADGGRLLWPTVLGLVKRGDTSAEGWAAFEASLSRFLAIGEQLPRLSTGGRGSRESGVIRASTGDGGHVFYGPYVTLPAGEYRARIELAGLPPMSTPALELVAEVASASATPATMRFWPAPDAVGALEITLPFPVGLPGGMPVGEPIEIRLWSNGLYPFEVRSVAIEEA